MSNRLSVRLDQHLSDVLARRCVQTGQTLSEIVRQALESTLLSDTRETTPVTASEPPKTANPGYVFPPQLRELLPRHRAVGMAIRQQQRRLYENLLAASEVVRESGERSQQDEAICSELLDFGKRFGFVSDAAPRTPAVQN